MDQEFAVTRCVRAAGSRGPHWHGAPCWQPHWQDEATAAGVWQPQVQLAPTQSVHEQFFIWVFIVMLQVEWQAGIGLSAFWVPSSLRS
ncbi:MAG TPA: hypothetical protein VN731_05025 [Rhodanobacter sp.]|nr:hypothetical protein [Rhodanobacter sp.]